MKHPLISIIAVVIYLILIWKIPDVVDVEPIWIIIALTVLFLAVLYVLEYVFHKVDNVKDIEKKILNNLKSEGYGCSMDEGVMVYEMNGRKYRTHFWNMHTGLIRTAILDYAVIDDDWNKVSIEGKAILANYVNGECPHVTFIAQKSGVLFQYITYVHGAEDFLPEAKVAYDLITEAVQIAVNVLPQIKSQYPVNGRDGSIGFVSRESEDDTLIS